MHSYERITEKRNSHSEPANKCQNVQIRCGSLSITVPVSLMANEFYVQSIKHWQGSLVAINQSYIFNKTMNGCKDLKIHSRLALNCIYSSVNNVERRFAKETFL